MEPPVPPSVNDGRITRGKPSWSQRRSASFALFTNADAGTSRPILRQASLNHRRSSATCGSRTLDRKSTRLNSSHVAISYAVFCLKKKKKKYSGDYDEIL